MINPLRAWIKLIIRSLPRKSWRDNPEKIKSVAVARVTGTFVILTVTTAYYVLNAIFPTHKNLWGISFLVITLALYFMILARIFRLVKYWVRSRDKSNSTRQ